MTEKKKPRVKDSIGLFGKKDRKDYTIKLPPNKDIPTGKVVKEGLPRGASNLTGRHSRYYPELVDELEGLYRTHHYLPKVCMHLKVSSVTYRNWRKKYPEFDEAHEKCMEIMHSHLIDELVECSHNKERVYAPIIWLSKAIAGWREPDKTDDENDKEKVKLMSMAMEAADKLRKSSERDY